MIRQTALPRLPCLICLLLPVVVAVGTSGAGSARRSRCRARPAVCPLGAICVLPGDAHLVPQAAVEVEVVAPGLVGSAVADVGVQRMPVVGELTGAAGPGDRADPARQARAGCGGAGHRGPVHGAA